MKIYKFLSIVLAVVGINANAALPTNLVAPNLLTKFKHVELKEFTTLQLNVIPDVGMQLIFPFLLDDPLLSPQIKIDLTNEGGFTVPAISQHKMVIPDQNTITIIANPNQSATIGTLFINVGGYNISIALRTVFNVKDMSPNVIFEISEDERNHLITHTVERYKKALKAEHDEAMAKVEERARDMALAYVGEVALAYPKTKRFISEFPIALESGRIIFFADRMLEYNNFSVLAFEIQNVNSHDINIMDISLIGYENKKDTGKNIRGNFLCAETIAKGATIKCSFTSTAPLAQLAQSLEISVTTDIGTGKGKW